MTVTLKDVARASGCSFQAVSAILGSRADQFSRELRDRVVAQAQRLGYRPSRTARSLRAGRTGSVALLKGVRPGDNTVPNAVLHGVTEVLDGAGMHLVVLTLDDAALSDAERLPESLRQVVADGVLVKYESRIPPGLGRLLRRLAIPAVWINSRQRADCVHPDDRDAGERATRELIALGHRRIAYAEYWYDLGDDVSTHYSALDRYAGYRAAMRAGGLEPVLIGGSGAALHARRLAVSDAVFAARARPTAILTNGVWAALPLWHAAMRRGLAVPDDLSLFTFENHDTDELGVRISQLHIPEAEVGREAARLLLAKLRGRAAAAPPLALPFRHVPGDTCAAPRQP